MGEQVRGKRGWGAWRSGCAGLVTVFEGVDVARGDYGSSSAWLARVMFYICT